MAFLFQKFQEAVNTLAKSRTFAKDPRKLQFEADMNRLFLYSSYNRLGRNAEEADADEIIEMAAKASLFDQEKQVQENVHYQINSFCKLMDQILLPDAKETKRPNEVPQRSNNSRQSGLSLAVGRTTSPSNCSDVPETKLIKQAEVSSRLKDLMGYTIETKPSQMPHKEAGQGLFLNGEADIGTVVAIYPGIIYSPAYYRYIPGYPRIDAQNSYLITRYDGTVINAQPWGLGGETREVWNGLNAPEINTEVQNGEKGGPDRFWRLLSKPLEGNRMRHGGDILERRNPLALAHYANHPAKGMAPNVMICPYDFPMNEKNMRVYIPNTIFGNAEEMKMKRLGSFWFRYGSSKNSGSNTPILKTLVLVATRVLCDEEILLNYRLSSLKRRPEWYTPMDEEEDKRRWG